MENKNIMLRKMKIILMFKQTVQVITTGLLSFNNVFESWSYVHNLLNNFLPLVNTLCSIKSKQWIVFGVVFVVP